MVIVRFKIRQNERRIKEMSAKSIANEREELVDEPRFRPTRQRSRMQHRPDALPPETLCKLPSLVFPDVYLEQLLRPTVAWERVEQRRQERMRGHTQSARSGSTQETKTEKRTSRKIINPKLHVACRFWGSCADPGRNTRVNILHNLELPHDFQLYKTSLVQGWLGCKGRYGQIHGGPRGLPCRRRRAYARQSHALRALHLLGRGRFAHLDCNARASLDLRRQIVKVRMLERVFGCYPLGGVVLQHLCYQGEAARIELWAEDIEREPRLRVLAPLGLELG